MPSVLAGAIARWAQGEILVHRIARWASHPEGVHFTTVCNLQGVFKRHHGLLASKEPHITTCLWCAVDMHREDETRYGLP